MSPDRAVLRRAIERGEQEGGSVEFKERLTREHLDILLATELPGVVTAGKCTESCLFEAVVETVPFGNVVVGDR